jgi:tetratricopeptide (TPR) repeat protein
MGVSSSPGDRPTSEQRLDAMKQEIDALQVEVMKSRGPWYKQVPVVTPLVIAGLALIFSMATTFIAERRVAREEEHSNRVELRELIQRLIALPKENFELTQKYRDNPSAAGLLSSLINTESLVLGAQAADLISKLPGDLTLTEYFAVAYSLSQSGQSETSQQILAQGLEAAKANPDQDLPGLLALLRQEGSTLFSTERASEGRGFYRQALSVVNQSSSSSQYVANVNGYTEYVWANAELSIGECDEARQHVAAAQRYLPQMTAPVQRSQVLALPDQIKATCSNSQAPPG